MILLGQDSAIEKLATVLSYIASGGGAVVLFKILEWWVRTKQENRTLRAMEEKTAIDYYRDLVERGKKNLDDLEKEYRRVLSRMDEMTIKMARRDAYIESLEEKLDEKGTKYRKWRDTPGTEPPSVVPPPQPKKNGSMIIPAPSGDSGMGE